MLPQRILIIDDDPEIVDAMSSRMENFGFECFGYSTPEDAIREIKNIRPDLVLMDLGYANNGGTGFLNEMKRCYNGEDNIPPVIVMNGENDYHVIEYAFDAGTMELFYTPMRDLSFGGSVSDCLPNDEILP